MTAKRKIVRHFKMQIPDAELHIEITEDLRLGPVNIGFEVFRGDVRIGAGYGYVGKNYAEAAARRWVERRLDHAKRSG